MVLREAMVSLIMAEDRVSVMERERERERENRKANKSDCILSF